MAMTLTPEHDYEEVHTSGRRRKIAKFALAGIAVLGIGASLTSAAWSDSVFFGGTAEGASFELQGLDPSTGTWHDADSSGTRIQLPSSAFDNIAPDSTSTYKVQVKNAGSVDITLGTPKATTSGGLFGSGGAYVQFGNYVDEGPDSHNNVLSPGEVAKLDVQVKARNWTGTQFVGATGNVIVQIKGQS